MQEVKIFIKTCFVYSPSVNIKLNRKTMKKPILLFVLFTFIVLKTFAQCPTCTYVASSQAVGNTTDVTIAKPTGVMPNDVMIAAIHDGWCNSGSTVTAPAGWTLISNTSNTGPGCGSANTSIQLSTFYRVAGASEPLSYTFTGNTNQLYVGGIVAYSGVSTATTINASSNYGAQELCASIVADSVTTTASCTRLVAVFFCSVNSSLNNIVPQNSLTERVDVGTTGNHPWGNENLEISDEIMSSAGSTGNKTAYLTGCSGASWVTGAQLIALECSSVTSVPNNNSLSGLNVVIHNTGSGVFELSLNENLFHPSQIYIYDCFGRMIRTGEIRENKTSIDLTTQAKGIYIVKVTTSAGSYIQKISVQ